LAKHLYWAYLDYDKARNELDAARRALPNDPTTYLLLGYIDRRQGRWDESIRNMQQAAELDPRNFFILQQISLTYKNLRRYPDMAAVLDRALKLAPADASLRLQRAEVDLHWRGDPKPLRATLQSFIAENPNLAGAVAEPSFLLALYERDLKAASQALGAIGPDALYGYGKEGVFFPRAWCEGVVAGMKGDVPAAQAAFTAAHARVEKTVHEEPANGPALCALAMIDAALGRKKEAIGEGRHAVELLPVAKDSIEGPVLIEYLAAIYAATGKKDAAFDQLQVAVQTPGTLSYGQLRLDPMWDSLRADPRFEKIVASLAPKS
jgi:tetratricopeptide (TPR) repeat protein